MAYHNDNAHFQPYSDDTVSRSSIQQDYYDPNNIPPPHQMAERTSYPSYPPDSSPRGSFDQAPSNPFATPASEYTPVAARRYPAGYNNNSNMAYDNSGPLWSAGQAAGARAGGNKRKWWWVIGGIVALAIVLGAIIGGVVASQHKKSSSSSSSSSSSGSTSSGNTKGWVMSANNVVKYNPGDLSQFEKDPRLLPSMYGIAYSPAGSILPSCGASFDQVLEDVYLMSQLTTRVRLYGTDCNATELVIDAIQRTKTNLSVYIGIYVDNDDSVYFRQQNETAHIIQTYGTDQILGITVGNEFILDNLTALGSTDPTSAAGISAAEFLIAKIQDMRALLASLSLPKTIPVGNGDAGSFTNVQLLGAVDYFMSNIHPWFGNLPVDQAAGWTWEFFQQNNVNLGAETTNHPDLMIAEVGWPSGSNSTTTDSDGPSLANQQTLQTFMNDWICQSNANGTQWFWFEFFDEEWKEETYGGVEGFWGLFSSTKQLKNVTIPNCKSS